MTRLALQVESVARALQADVTFRGLISSPLGVVIAALTLGTVIRRFLAQHWPS